MSAAGVNGFRADRFAEKRKEHGLTKVETARRMHLSLSGYTNFERGERTRRHIEDRFLLQSPVFHPSGGHL